MRGEERKPQRVGNHPMESCVLNALFTKLSLVNMSEKRGQEKE